VLERGVTVGEHTTIERAVVLRGREIGANCTLQRLHRRRGRAIGDHCHVDGLSVLGEGVTLGAGNIVSNGARIFPGVTLPDGRCVLMTALDARRRRRGRLDRPGGRDPRPAEHLRDALWRVDSGGSRRSTRPAA
jgi:UDP-3-O-[3-hydroxymyristoyl] glucosamine N-acyltransferase